MEKKPFFSVLVAAHNAEKFIRKGLGSIRDQSFQDYELIVMIDNCTDNTEAIVKEYIRPEQDKAVVGSFGSGSASYNAGLDLARGEWVLFMDHDDWWLHEFAFEMIAKALTDTKDVDIMTYGFIWKGFGLRFSTPTHLYPAQWTKVCRREFIGDTRFPTEWSAIGDYGFAASLREKNPRIMCWEMPFYYYNYLCEGSASLGMKGEDYQNDFSDIPPDAQKAARAYIESMKNNSF